jgi:ribosome-binding protein aMBF1 (putative translation factor)
MGVTKRLFSNYFGVNQCIFHHTNIKKQKKKSCFMECFKCGASGTKVRIFDAISGKGIVKICERCSEKEGLPLIKRPTSEQLKRAESNTPVRKVLEKISGNTVSEKEDYERDKKMLEKQEITLRELVERKYKDSPKRSLPRPDLIDNFHWIIMRARRGRKISHKQLAEALSESETVLQMAEKGILPEDDNKLINKLETFFGVQLIKNKSPFSSPRSESFSSKMEQKNFEGPSLSFDPYTSKRITLSDLQEIKKKKEEDSIETFEEKSGSKKPIKDLTPEEIEKIIYGK